MQISFGHGLIKIGMTYVNPDRIIKMEEADDKSQTKIHSAGASSDFTVDAPVSKVAAACVMAQTAQRVIDVNEYKK